MQLVLRNKNRCGPYREKEIINAELLSLSSFSSITKETANTATKQNLPICIQVNLCFPKSSLQVQSFSCGCNSVLVQGFGFFRLLKRLFSSILLIEVLLLLNINYYSIENNSIILWRQATKKQDAAEEQQNSAVRDSMADQYWDIEVDQLRTLALHQSSRPKQAKRQGDLGLQQWPARRRR